MRKFFTISGLSYGVWAEIGRLELEDNLSDEAIHEGVQELTAVLKTHTDAQPNVPCSISMDYETHGFVFRPREFAALKVDVLVVE